jgi:hypothetical protein
MMAFFSARQMSRILPILERLWTYTTTPQDNESIMRSHMCSLGKDVLKVIKITLNMSCRFQMKLSMANIWVYHLMLADPKIGILLI